MCLLVSSAYIILRFKQRTQKPCFSCKYVIFTRNIFLRKGENCDTEFSTYSIEWKKHKSKLL